MSKRTVKVYHLRVSLPGKSGGEWRTYRTRKEAEASEARFRTDYATDGIVVETEIIEEEHEIS